jgi:hypothetical protein
MTGALPPLPIPPIACPACGAQMNPHAEKPVHGPGDIVLEIHQCPACARVESRRSA